MLRLITLLFFLISSMAIYGQSIVENITNKTWKTKEGIELRFTDSIMEFTPLASIKIIWKDSAIYSKHLLTNKKNTDNCRAKIADIIYSNDSIELNFEMSCFIGDKKYTMVENLNYQSFFSSKKLRFYSEKAYKETENSYFLDYFKDGILSIDSSGHITIETSHFTKLSSGRYIDGVYRGKLDINTLKEFKRLLKDSIVNFKPSRITRYNGYSVSYHYETTNLRNVITKNFRKRIGVNNTLHNLFYTDSAWATNHMSYFGYSKDANIPLRQITYHYDFQKLKLSPMAMSGNYQLMKKVSTRKESRYIYRLAIETIHDNPEMLKYYPKSHPQIDTLFFVSDYELENPNRGLIIRFTTIRNSDPLLYLKRNHKLTTSYYELLDTFPISNTEQYVFDFNLPKLGKDGREIRRQGRVLFYKEPTTIYFKLSRELRKLDDSYYY